MRTSIEKKVSGFQFKPSNQKHTAKDQTDLLKKAIDEAKRQAYADMGLYQ